MTRVLIVAVTRISPYKACVGALSTDGTPYRLLEKNGSYPDIEQYCLGEVWELELRPSKELEPPHVENARVVRRRRDRSSGRSVAELGELLRSDLLPRYGIKVWRGPPEQLFGGALGSIESGTRFVDEGGPCPAGSTGFYEPDFDISLADDNHYWNGEVPFRVRYVGLEPAKPALKSGGLLRVSLARWWQRTPDDPRRCYLQLSGWY